MCQWLKKLSELRNDKLSDVKMKHEYMQYLRVSLQGDYKLLTKPFNDSPPDDLVPFPEMIANKTADAIPGVPRAGKFFRPHKAHELFTMEIFQLGILQPVLCHKSGDDRAFMCVKRTPDNGILCYMAVAPDASAIHHQ